MAGLIDYIQKGLKKVADVQIKYLWIVILVLLGFTIFSAMGLSKIHLESDFDKMNPQDLPVMKLSNKIDTEFQEFESVVIVVELDDSLDSDTNPKDIRDPAIIEFMTRLQKNLEGERTIQNVQSAGLVFSQMDVPEDLESTKRVLSNVPGSEKFFDRGYELTLAFIEADVGGDTEKIQALDEKVNEIIEESGKPGGVKVTTTGDAPLGSAIFQLLISDSFFTLIFSTIAIFLLIVVLEASFKRGLIVLFPLLLGLTWTAGTLGWLGISITIATAGLSAMLLGLGMEYSIFLVSRYNEERKKHDVNYAVSEAVVQVGGSLAASGSTTLIGFLALTLSMFPVLSDLGLSLAIGIAFMLASTILAAPVILLVEDKIERALKGEKEIIHEEKVREKKFKKLKIEKVYRGYGKLVANRPWTVLSAAVIITVLMFYGMTLIKNQDIDFETVLPADLEEMVAFRKLNDEFGERSSALIYVEVSPEFFGSDEPQDIRDPRVLEYIDLLGKKAMFVQDVQSVDSLAEVVKDANEGIIPRTIATEQTLFDSFAAQDLINEDYSATLIRISANEDAVHERHEFTNQLYKIIDETEKPAGVKVRASGGLVVESELDAINGPDSQKTSLVSLLGIVVFLYILTRSFKNTFLPLVTVVLGIIWTLGLGGFFGEPFNNITTSVITMTIGIGIDFGLQIMLRYNYELRKHDKRKAMEETMTNIMTPMVITVIAALIGFSAMNLGQLKLMGDLGTMMSFGVAGSMFAAVTGVAALYVLFQKEKREKPIGYYREQQSLKVSKRGKVMKKMAFLLGFIILAANVGAITETVVMKDYVVDFEYDEADVKAGETFRLTATVANEAGETRSDIELFLELDSPFDNVGDDSKSLGVLEDGEEKAVSFRIEVDEDAGSDDYTIDFEIKDNEDKDSDEFSVSVESNRAELIIGNVESLPTTISPDLEDVKLTLTIENTEDEDADFVRAKLILPEGFTPSGSYSDSANLGRVAAGESKDVDFFVDTSERVSSGVHKGILELTYDEGGDSRIVALEFDLPVKGRSQFQIIRSNTGPATISENDAVELRIIVENVGEEEGKETSVRVFENSDQPFSFDEKTNFIGDLLPGESGTATLKFTVDSGAVEKTYLVRVQTRTVDNGNVLVEEMTVPVRVSAPQETNWTYYVIGLAVVLVVVLIFFVFRMTR
ncbi:MAG: MMPL family transporter [archaeon]